MKKRIGNDIHFTWTVKRKNGELLTPEDFTGKECVVELIDDYHRRCVIDNVVFGEGTVSWTFWGKDQRATGAYTAVLSENRGAEGMVTIDTVKAVVLVSHSYQEEDDDAEGVIEAESVELESEIGQGIDAYTKAETDALLAEKQDVVEDLDTIRSGAGAGATAYQKPQTGIPPSDMSSAVQTSLGKADTALQTETDPTVPAWAKAQNKPTYTAQEVGALPDSTSIPSALSDLTDDTTHRTVTDTEKTAWNNKSDFSGSYNDLSDKPTIPTVPSNVSAFNNDAGYLTATDVYTKAETYNKTEVNNLITAPNQQYVSVTATAQTTAVTDLLPINGESDTIYRVGNWDGTQYNDSVFSEYAWNGSAYIELSTKSQVGEVYDISANHADTKYSDLAAALGTNGANIPQSLRKGGMSIKFVQTSDNKYVQARCMAQNFTTDITQWQGVDSEPVAGSRNLVESGGVVEKLVPLQYETNGITDLLYNTDSNNGSSLITLKNTPQSFVTVTLSGNIGETNVISCNDNLANKDKIVYGKSWTGSDNANRAILKAKVKPTSKFSVIYSGIDSVISVSAFETNSYNASTSKTSHPLTSGEKSTFVTYSKTEWLVIQFLKTSPISPSDLANLIIRCNEGETIINIDNISDIVNISGNGTGMIKCFDNLTYIYTENDNAQIDVSCPTKVALVPYLIVCGYDAKEPAKSIARKAMENGYGYICGESEYDDELNSFIDSFIDVPIDIHFYGTIRTKFGIHKHPLHNLYGSNCTVKMGDNIGTDYVSCIFPTSGGLTFEQQQVISHHYTVIKGFTLDGNCENNKVGTNYVFDDVYGGVIMPGIYNEKVSPYSRTQSVKDLILENIKAVNTMRGIIVGTNWICRNLEIGDSVTDHALYLAGSDNAIVENVYITGTHKNGAIAISPQSWVTSRMVRNIHLRNIKLDECIATDGPLLDIRGHFSDWGNNKCLDNIFIDGLFIKNINTALAVRCIVVGTRSDRIIGGGFLNYPMNVHLDNVCVDARIRNNFLVAYNANVVAPNMYIIMRDYKYDRPLFNIQSNSNIMKAFDFHGMRILVYMDEIYSEKYTIFGVDNSAENYLLIDGLNIDDASLRGLHNNFYLFGRVGDSDNKIAITDISAERLCIYPEATMSDSEREYIELRSKTYYVIS